MSEITDKLDTVINEEGLIAVPKDIGISGDMDMSDIQPPRLQILQRGNKDFGAGSLTLEGYKISTPATIVILAFVKDFIENLDLNDDMQKSMKAKIFSTKNEVEANNGRIAQWEKGPDIYTARGRMLTLVMAPKSKNGDAADDGLVDITFPYSEKLEDRTIRFAAATWTVARTAYTSISGPIVNVIQTGRPLRDIVWNLDVEEQSSTKGSFTWFTPSLSIKGTTPAALKPHADQFYNGVNSLLR